MGMRKEVGDLRLERACVDNFAERSIRTQRQKVARNVERPRAEGSLVGLLFHISGLRRQVCEVTEGALGERFVIGEKALDRFAIKLRLLIVSEIRRVVA